jgi:outer membrane protein assembly factor BamB
MKIYSTVLILFLWIPALVDAQTTGWNNGGGNWFRNGYMDAAGPTTDSVLWQVNSDGFFGTPIFIEGNYLVTMRFLGMTNAPVECYDLTSGNLLWSVDVTNSSGRSLPVGLHDERVFVVRFTESPNDTLYALDVSNGSHLWTSNVNVAPYISETGVFDSIGNFYIHNSNFHTYKINPVNGQMIWQTFTVPMASGSGEMAINNSNNTGYTLEIDQSNQSCVWAIDLATGQKKYSQTVPAIRPGGNFPQSALMVGFNGVVYVQLTEDNVAALSDNGTGFTLLWQTEIYGNGSFSLMCVGADGSIYAPTDGKIVRLDPLTGDTLRISATITQGGFFLPRISATNNNMIYVTNGENYVYAFDHNLNLIWSDDLPNTNTSGVCIAPNGLAAVCGQNTIRVYTPTQTVGIPETEDVFVSLYPNPTSSYVTLTFENIVSAKDYSIIDSQGKIIRKGKIFEKCTTLNLADLNSGLYFLQIEGLNQTIKIVKK